MDRNLYKKHLEAIKESADKYKEPIGVYRENGHLIKVYHPGYAAGYEETTAYTEKLSMI